MYALDRKKAGLLASLRGGGIVDERVLAAMDAVPREEFIPAALRERAYEESALPIGLGQTISLPFVVAYMCQELKLDAGMTVFEVGTGCGYHAAVLSKLCRRVCTLERHKPLLKETLERFEMLRLRNITAMAADGTRGWPLKREPFDRIILTAAPEDRPPQALFDQLAVGGILLAPVGDMAQSQILRRYTKHENGLVTHEDLIPVRFVPLLPNVSDEDYNPNEIDGSHAIGKVMRS
jgi:protein-L-isoaspartate(D-aspartate) O-methyltransferase